jgi:hypothetical protein
MKKVGWGWQRTLLLSAIPLTRVYGQNGTCRGKRDTEGERDFISIQLDARRNALEVRSGIAYEHTRCFILIKTPMYVHAIPLDNELDALCYAYVRACYSAVQRTLRSTRSSSYPMRMYVDAILLYNEQERTTLHVLVVYCVHRNTIGIGSQSNESFLASLREQYEHLETCCRC